MARQRIPWFGTLCFTLALSSTASTLASDLTEADFLSEIPLTSTATRLPQQIQQAPASITVIDRRMIEASSAVTLSEILRLVPGMQAYFTATNTAAAAYHGVSDKFPPRMEVMIDGRSVYIPLFSTVLWDALPITLQDVERIEVVRGTNTVTQGSNAFLGAINIITRSPLTDDFNNALQLTAGQFDTRNIQARHGGLHQQGHYTLTAGLLSNDGNTLYNGDQDPYSNRYINFSTSLSPDLRNTFTLDLGYTRGFTTVGDIDDEIELGKREQESHYQYLRWHRMLSDQTEMDLSYSHSYLRLDADNLDTDYVRQNLNTDPLAAALSLDPVVFAQQFLDANDPYRFTGEVGDTQVHDIELAFTHHFSETSNLVAGVGYKSDRARSRELLDSHDWISEERYRLFGHWEYKGLPQWQFNNGVMIENAGHGATRVSPRLAANYQWSENTTLRASIARAYRMPSLLERHLQNIVYNPAALVPLYQEIYEINTLGNEDLRPEQIDSFDIGFLQRWPAFHSDLDIRLFHERIRDGISTTFLPLDTPITQPGGTDTRYRTEANRANWYNYGVDMQYRYQSDHALNPLFVLSYGYIETRGERNYGKQAGISNPDVIDDLADRNPAHTVTALAGITLPQQWQLSATYYYLTQVRWLEGSGNEPNDAYHRTDLKLSKLFNLPQDQTLNLAFTAQNLDNSVPSEFYTRNHFGRRYYMQMEWQF